MRIGPYRLRNRLIVAPMAGVTDRPFRMLCKRLGAGHAVLEMITADQLLYGTAKTQRRINFAGELAPVSVQIAGADRSSPFFAVNFPLVQSIELPY
jgi:tRNA-dihydrouridine synthase B